MLHAGSCCSSGTCSKVAALASAAELAVWCVHKCSKLVTTVPRAWNWGVV